MTEHPDSFWARSRAHVVSVHFAPTAGVVNTLEGPVAYLAGDAIITGVAGEQWSVPGDRFRDTYIALAPTSDGKDGLYTKHPHMVLALRLTKECSVPLKGGRGILRGHVGDYLVQYGPGDYAVVAGDIFDVSYERSV